jgi:hypothetical protein
MSLYGDVQKYLGRSENTMQVNENRPYTFYLTEYDSYYFKKSEVLGS